jgi:hypothetical protein
MRKSHFNQQSLVLLGLIISRFLACSDEGKKHACSSPISMLLPSLIFCSCTFLQTWVKMAVADKHASLLRFHLKKSQTETVLTLAPCAFIQQIGRHDSQHNDTQHK